MTSLCPSPLSRMDEIVLKPHFSCGVCWQDKKTGVRGKEKSFHFSTTTTLWNMFLWFISLLFVMKAFFWLMQMRGNSKMRKKYRKKMRKQKAKMSKS